MNKRRAKGEGTVRKRKDGRWEGRFIDCLGEPQSIYAKTKAEVLDKLKLITYITNHNLPGMLGGEVKCDIWFEHYIQLKSLAIKKRSLYQVRLAYKNHFQPVIGDKRMMDINIHDLSAIYKRMQSRNYSNKTLKTNICHLRAMLRFAKEEGVLQQVPILPIKIDESLKSPRRDLAPAEIDLILTTAYNHDYKSYLMILILVCTGIRAGELCGLKWDNFYSNYHFMKIDESRTDNIYENTTKSDSSKRIIPIPDVLAEELSAYHITHPHSEYGGHVFVNRCKRLYTTQNIEKRLHYVTKLVLEKGYDLTFVTPHYFRHTYATTGLNQGSKITDMMALLGHSMPESLMNYNHQCTTSMTESTENIYKSLFQKENAS